MLLAIDPGRTTGLAWRKDTVIHDGLAWRKDTVIHTDYTTDVESILFMVGTVQEVVIEDYSGQLISSDGLFTVRLIGIIEGVCWEKDIPLYIQRNMERKAQLDAAKTLLGYPNRHTKIHEVDALAHLLRFEYNTDQGIPHRKRDWTSS